MNKLTEIRSQEYMCRERAALDSERRIFWLSQAEEWEQRALDEIAYHFRECNLDQADVPALAPGRGGRSLRRNRGAAFAGRADTLRRQCRNCGFRTVCLNSVPQSE